MTRTRNLAALIALASVVALPACSMFGGDSSSRASRSSASQSAAAPTYSNSAQAAPAQTGPLTPETVRSVQQSLQQDGLYRGRVDGVWGPATQAAVRGYQQRHNMTVTGQLDADTMSAMNIVQRSAQQEPPDSQRYGSNSPPQDSNTGGQSNAGMTR